jgi:glycosyltransferase involved in cell wall biosynthesis
MPNNSQQNLHVLHVITTIARGGAESQLLMVAKGQIDRGYTVTVCPLKGELELEREFKRYGVEVVKNLHSIGLLAQIQKMKKLARNRYSIVHAHLPQAELLVSICGLRNYVVSRHFGGQFFPGRNIYVSRWLSKFAVRNAGSVIAISEAVAQFLITNRELQESTVLKVVPYGFDEEIFLRTEKRDSPLRLTPNKARIFGTIARLSPEKDLPTLIKAFYLHQLDPEFKGHKLRIFGAGPLEKMLGQLISNYSLKDSVELMGRTQFPERALAGLDVFVLTSTFEGFGMVLLEAMSLKKPIICSRIPAAQEVLGEDGAAIFFVPGDEQDLAAKMKNLEVFVNPGFLKRQEARLEKFAISKSVSQLHEIYGNILKSQSKSI